MIRMEKMEINGVKKDISYLMIEPIIRSENNRKIIIILSDLDNNNSCLKSNRSNEKKAEEQTRRRKRRNYKLKLENKIDYIIRNNETEINPKIDQQNMAEISSKSINNQLIILFVNLIFFPTSS